MSPGRTRHVSACALLVIAACGFPQPARVLEDGTESGDGGTNDADTARRCRTWSPFTTPVLVDELVDAAHPPMDPTLSADQLDLLFTKDDNLYEATRPHASARWSAPMLVAGFPVSGNLFAPLFVGDRLHVIYGLGSALYRTERPTPTAAFAYPGELLTDAAADPALSPDGTLLVYDTATTDGLRLDFLQLDPITHTPTGSGFLLQESGWSEETPAIGDHGRTLIWSRRETYQQPAVLMSAELTNTALGPRQDLGLNPSSYQDAGPSLTDDGATLIYTSRRVAVYPTAQLYVTHRTCEEYQ